MTVAKGAKSAATPRLRFPEFRNNSEWGDAKLGDLIRTITPPAKLQTSRYHGQGKIPIIDQSQEFICGWTDDETAVITESLPLIVFGDHTCVLKFVQQPFAQGADGIKILKAKPVISIAYLFQSLNHQPLVMEDYKRHFATLKERRVFFPEIASGEQQKIADCLTSLGEVIAAQGRKVEALKVHKRGLMQQLFPREGETVPQLRFPEFRDGPEWEDVAIGDLGKIIPGNTPATSRQEYYGGDRLFVSPADVSDLRFVERTKTTLSEAGFAQCRPIQALSVLFVCIGSTIGKVAQNTRECATNQQINAVVVRSGFSSDFIYYLLCMESVRIAKLAGKQAVPIVNKSLFSSVRVMTPSLEEQLRIADCLSSLDTQITAESNRLTALKTHKQGLMQLLFPVPEATGA